MPDTHLSTAIILTDRPNVTAATAGPLIACA